MWVGSTSSGLAAALGLPVRKGSMSTRLSPSTSSKHAWPRKRISMSVVVSRFGFGQLSCEFPTDRHADEHPHPGLLREQRLDALRAQRLVGLGDRGAYLGAVCIAEPTPLLQRV